MTTVTEFKQGFSQTFGPFLLGKTEQLYVPFGEVRDGSVIKNDTKKDGSPILDNDLVRAILVTPPKTGTLTKWSIDGHFSWEPPVQGNQIDSFEYQLIINGKDVGIASVKLNGIKGASDENTASNIKKNKRIISEPIIEIVSSPSIQTKKTIKLNTPTGIETSETVSIFVIPKVDLSLFNLANRDGELVPVNTIINGIWWPDAGGTGIQDWNNLNSVGEKFNVTINEKGVLVIPELTPGSGLIAFQWRRQTDGLLHTFEGRFDA